MDASKTAKICIVCNKKIPAGTEYADIDGEYACVECFEDMTPRQILQLCGYGTNSDDKEPVFDSTEIKRIYEKSAVSINKELEAFKAKMLDMPQEQMYSQPALIYCFEHTAYFMTEYVFSKDECFLFSLFNDKQITRLVKLCDRGTFIETVIARLKMMKTVHFSSMSEIGAFIGETLDSED